MDSMRKIRNNVNRVGPINVKGIARPDFGIRNMILFFSKILCKNSENLTQLIM